MRLSTRLIIAMVSIVLLTAAAVGIFSYRNLEAALVPAALRELQADADALATRLSGYVGDADADLLALRASTTLTDLMKVIGTETGTDGASTASGADDARLRYNLEREFAAQLNVKPAYLQLRLIAANGRELVRVDRSGPNGAVRVAGDRALQDKGNTTYVTMASKLPADGVYASRINLNREHDAIEQPPVPVMRLATPVYDGGALFGILVINLDMRPAFAVLQRSKKLDATVIVTDAWGYYLDHPDASREFSFEYGREYLLRSDLPELAQALEDDTPKTVMTRASSGERIGVALSPVDIGHGKRLAIIETMPATVILASARSVGISIFFGGLAAVLIAIGIAVLTAYSLASPLRRITAAVATFKGSDSLQVPEQAGGEIGELARAFRTMSDNLRQREEDARRETARRQRVEAELQHAGRVNAMGQMASAFAHELNQPLAAAANYVSAARRRMTQAGDERAEPAQGLLEKASAQIIRTGDIIRRLRDFVEKREASVTLQDINTIVSEALEFAMTGAPKIELRIQLAGELPPVLADRIQVQQVVVNLVRNALDAMGTEENGVITVSTEMEAGAFVCVSVADTGPGLPKEITASPFQPFVTSKTSGMGIGLSICKSIVEAHEGKLWYEAGEGGGAVFRFRLPCAQDKDVSDAA